MKSLFSCSMIFYCPKSRNLLVEYQAPSFLHPVYQCNFPFSLLCVSCVYTACYLRSNRYTWGKKYDFNETKINKCWA